MENQAPITGQPMQAQPSEKKSLGPILGVIIIIIVLVLGAFYIWGGKLSMSDKNTEAETSLAPVSDSDDVDSIESDLTAGGTSEIDFSDLDK
jgi:hypothetical protein